MKSYIYSFEVEFRKVPKDSYGAMTPDEKTLDEDFVKSRLFTAIKDRHNRNVITYIKKGDDVNLLCKKTGMTYLHLAIRCSKTSTEVKYVPIIYLLSNADIDLNVPDKSGCTPLLMSIKYGLLEIMEALLKCGADYILDPEENLFTELRGPCAYEIINRYKFYSPGYWHAVSEDRAFRVNVLVKSWCRINISRNGKTLIEFAKQCSGCEKIVKQLINSEATIEFAHATIAGDKFRMKYLMDHYNIDMGVADFSHRESYFLPFSPLSLYGAAIKYGHKDILELLKGDNNAQDKGSLQSSICALS